jgi:hypothetical protein
MRHRLRIAAALDKIILMIFDELKVGERTGTAAALGVLVRLSRGGSRRRSISIISQHHTQKSLVVPPTQYSRHAEITLAPPSPADTGGFH